MARPQRNTVDYFPFLCKEGKSNYYIEKTYGNDGFATWVKILRELAKSENHYLNLRDEIQLMFLSAKCNIDKTVLESIINDLCLLGEFDKELWEEDRIIFNQTFIESIEDAYKKRSNTIIDKKSLLLILQAKGIRKPPKSIPKHINCSLEGDVKPQSKEEYIKEDKRKEEESKKFDYKSNLINLGVEENIISEWMEIRRKKKATNSETAFKSIHNQIKKSGLSANDCIKIAVIRDWKGFNSDWVKPDDYQALGIKKPTEKRSSPQYQSLENYEYNKP